MATEREPVPSWVRYGGIAAILASILEVLTTLLIELAFPEAFVPGTRDALIVGNVVITYLVLGVVGVAALYARYDDAFGWVGTLGLLSIAVGAVVGIVAVLTTRSIAGGLLNLVLVFGGAALLSVGLWRIATVPRSGALLMGASPVAAVVAIVGFLALPGTFLGPLGFLVLEVVWGAAWIVLGYHLWTGGSDGRRNRDEREAVRT